jgi:hypothetical protein
MSTLVSVGAAMYRHVQTENAKLISTFSRIVGIFFLLLCASAISFALWTGFLRSTKAREMSTLCYRCIPSLDGFCCKKLVERVSKELRLGEDGV